MKFWDTSALLPLLLEEPTSSAMFALHDEDSAIAVWMLTSVEITTAIWRRQAADALQLAAAVWMAGGDPATLPFVTLDHRLADAARAEGFPVLP